MGGMVVGRAVGRRDGGGAALYTLAVASLRRVGYITPSRLTHAALG